MDRLLLSIFVPKDLEKKPYKDIENVTFVDTLFSDKTVALGLLLNVPIYS